MKKKKIIIIVAIVIFVLMLIPISTRWKNGVIGYITAGHCFGKMGYTVVSSTVTYGTFVNRSYTSTMDAAFVKLGSGHTILNNLNSVGYQASFINTTGSNYYTTGTSVGKYGKKTGYGSGVVGSLNFSGTDQFGDYHTGLAKANITTGSGDSGGPVFTVNATTLNNGAPLIGVISVGGANYVGWYNYNNIITALGLTKY